MCADESEKMSQRLEEHERVTAFLKAELEALRQRCALEVDEALELLVEEQDLHSRDSELLQDEEAVAEEGSEVKTLGKVEREVPGGDAELPRLSFQWTVTKTAAEK